MHSTVEVKMSEVLFQITEENLDTGLRGYPVGYCPTSSVDPIKGLFYSEIPVSELSFENPENVIYLLMHGKKGQEKEVEEFTKKLQERSKCSPELIQSIKALPRKGHPMQLFIAALILAGVYEGKNDYREDCLNVIAKMPEIAATVINHHAGWGGCNPSNNKLGYMENFTQMLKVPNANQEHLTKIFRIFNVLHFDHGGGNLSTFIGKAVSSGLQDMYGSLAAAMSALAGPRHGRANQDCLEFVKDVYKDVGDNATAASVEKDIRKRLENNQLVFGFGHAVLRVEDPRATLLYEIAKKEFPKDPLVKIATLLRTEGTKVLKENPKISDPYPNVDAISGTVLSAAGFPYPEYFTILFGLSRCVGIARQIVFDRLEARGGKGTPIVRPKYIYKRLDA